MGNICSLFKGKLNEDVPSFFMSAFSMSKDIIQFRMMADETHVLCAQSQPRTSNFGRVSPPLTAPELSATADFKDHRLEDWAILAVA